MAAITNTRPSIHESTFQGALNGGIVGFKAGVGVVSIAAFQHLLEYGARNNGYPPRWPFFEGDCQLEQFRYLAVCINPSSFLSDIPLAIGAATLLGAMAGAVLSVARNYF